MSGANNWRGWVSTFFPHMPDRLIRATKDTDRLILIGHMSSHQ